MLDVASTFGLAVRSTMNETPPDVLIAGAGPAGSVAALVLARAGARVQVIDRARFPRDKLCGDTINPGTLAMLRRLGVSTEVERRGVQLRGMLVSGLCGVSVQGDYGPSVIGTYGLAIRRRELDMILVTAAVDAGAKFDDEVTVRGPLVDDGPDGLRIRGLRVMGRGKRDLRVPARLTIAADGRRSIVATALGMSHHPSRPRRWVVGGYFEDVKDLSSYGEMHVRRDHFLGVAPLPEQLTNACVVSAARDRFANPYALLQTAITTDSSLRDRFAGARLVGPVASMGPLAVDATRAELPGLLLAGDAAGFIDPITGDGIRFAVRGGELAARTALDMLATDRWDAHTRLAQLRDAEFGPKWRFNRAVRVLVGSRWGVQAGTLGALIAPGVLRRVIRYAGDTHL